MAFGVGTRLIRRFSTNPPTLTTELYENILAICINRPKKRNAVDQKTAIALAAAFDQFEHDESIPVAILHGAGGTFCSGYDLASIGQDGIDQLRTKERPSPMGPSSMRFSKPVIAAVDGYAVAGGFELALMADLRVMESNAVFGVFCRRFGVPLIDGGTIRLSKLIGFSRAMDMVLTGREVTADEAHKIGLANVVCQPGSCLGQALQVARQIRKFPQKCLRADRRSMYYAAFDAKSWEDAFDFEFKNGMSVIAEEAVSGAKKFVDGVGRHGSFDIDQLRKPYHK